MKGEEKEEEELESRKKRKISENFIFYTLRKISEN